MHKFVIKVTSSAVDTILSRKIAAIPLVPSWSISGVARFKDFTGFIATNAETSDVYLGILSSGNSNGQIRKKVEGHGDFDSTCSLQLHDQWWYPPLCATIGIMTHASIYSFTQFGNGVLFW